MKKLINFFKKYNIFLKSINQNSLNNKIILIYFYLKTDITRIINKCFFKDRLINDKSLRLTENWYSNNLIYWWLLGKKFNFFNKQMSILEIGSFEGASACFFLKNFKNSNIFCVDTWSENFTEGTTNKNYNFNEVEKKFDQNTSKYNTRVKKFKMTSDSFFLDNKYKNYFDLIYVDGAHDYKSVIKDALNSFIFLKKDGVLIFDDFLKNQTHNAIMKFLEENDHALKIIFVYGQIIFRKT